jgi:hypothetical protein
MHSRIFSAGIATSISIEARHRIDAASGQWFSKNICCAILGHALLSVEDLNGITTRLQFTKKRRGNSGMIEEI